MLNSIRSNFKKLNPLVYYFIAWRVTLFLILLLGSIIAYRAEQDFTNLFNRLEDGSILYSIFLYPWANFDGLHYLAIAQWGYVTELGFFPLYPLLIKYFTNLTGGFSIENYFFFGFFYF